MRKYTPIGAAVKICHRYATLERTSGLEQGGSFQGTFLCNACQWTGFFRHIRAPMGSPIAAIRVPMVGDVPGLIRLIAMLFEVALVTQ